MLQNEKKYVIYKRWQFNFFVPNLDTFYFQPDSLAFLTFFVYYQLSSA